MESKLSRPKNIDVTITATVSFGDVKGEVSVVLPMRPDELVFYSHKGYNGCFEGLKVAVARYINKHLKESSR